MSENSWPEADSFSKFNPDGTLSALPEDDFAFDDLTSDNGQFDIDPAFLQGLAGRRLKSALMLGLMWGGTIALHQFTWGYWLTTGLAGLMGAHCLRAYVGRSRPIVTALAPDAVLPIVTLMVAAKNEEAVVDRLVDQLCNLDYPTDRYEVWFVNDASTDRTAERLDDLADRYGNLHVVHREPGALGGKSGALNQIFSRTLGEFIVVFDADAQIAPDFLRRSLGAFDRPKVGAVQLRKAIIQAETPQHPDRHNFWIQGQQAEMALDAFMRQQQIGIGGIGELRGNGQLVRRKALEDCGGWNEETITDDLDLTLRLHLHDWDIECLTAPAVYEEGVTGVVALWHQRSRWAEGGYQRYLDYWRMLLKNRLGWMKSIDLVVFVIMQYLMPMVAVPDLLMAAIKHQAPVFTPITIVTFGLFFLSAVRGLRRSRVLMPESERREVSGVWLVRQAIVGAIYMAHWLPVIAFTTARMAVRKKRLKWVKTVHSGQH
jgi:1,2-diacylglycerol 3-beta-glucosyltransferase